VSGRRGTAHAMNDDAPTPLARAPGPGFFFTGQLLHLGSIPFLAAVAWAFAAPALGDGHWLGVQDTWWFVLGLGVAVAHQMTVWIAWRAQLGWRVLTRIFGKADLAVWSMVFLPLLVSRPLALLGLAMADAGSAAWPRALGWTLGAVLAAPALYTLYCVHRHFGIRRAIGGDHFRERYRRMPLVRTGAFGWSPNAMYVFAFLGLWSIALTAGSLAALAVAFFQHAFIWAHYLGTEAPDMATIDREEGERAV